MSATAIVLLLCALACPVGMGMMMLFMRKGHGGSRRERPDEPAD
jgi:hypothetical protein